MKYINIKTGEVTNQVYVDEFPVFSSDGLSFKEISSALPVDFINKRFGKNLQLPQLITIGSQRLDKVPSPAHWLRINFMGNDVCCMYEGVHQQLLYVIGSTEKESRQKLYDLMKEKGLL